MLEINRVYNQDCIEGMKSIDDHSIDMILCDPPYGTTARCSWDIPLSQELLWSNFRRIIKENGAIIIMAAQPFATDVINNARDIFRYDLIWKKTLPVGGLNANRMPLRAHELILVFYKKLPVYNPQYEERRSYTRIRKSCGNNVYNDVKNLKSAINKKTVNPTSVIEYSNANHNTLHPTQKPLGLFEYLIKTYSCSGDLVLDPCMGSGTTAEACMNLQRKFIGYETDPGYFNSIQNRIGANCKKLDNWIVDETISNKVIT